MLNLFVYDMHVWMILHHSKILVGCVIGIYMYMHDM